MSVADEVNISRLNIVEPRRGYDVFENSLPSPSDRVSKFFFHDDELFPLYSNTLGLYESGGVVSRGSITKPTQAQSIRSQSMNGSLYLTSSTGIKKLDDTAENIYSAGIPKGVMIEQNGSLVTSGTALVEDYGTVAYRYIIGRKDAKNKTTYGGVSSRLIVFNNSLTDLVNVPLKVYLPAGLDTTHFVQVYRTKEFSGVLNTAGVPSDEMQVCWEQLLDSTMISNGYFTFTDIQPEALLGASLYTSPSQGGISSDNGVPPVSADLAVYKNRMFYADVKAKHRFEFTLVACGGSGLVVNDTITFSDGITTEVYTAKATENIGSKQFAVDVASASLATRIDSTIRSLANVINQGSALIYAYILSTGASNDLPGRIMIEERALGGAAFTTVSTRQAAFSPNLLTTADVNQTSTNDEFKNGLMFSKDSQPEAVPTKNVFFVGSAEDRISRIIPLQDGLFIFKPKDGAFVLRGENESSFSVLPLDLTAKIVAADSLVQLNNLIYGLFDAGVGAVSDSGVEYISEPIKDKIQYLIANLLDDVRSISFGVGYNVDGKYILAMPTQDGDTTATQQFVYDVFGNTWCRWLLNIVAGGVNPVDELLYIGPGDSNELKYERKTFEQTDFADFKALRTISAVDELELTLDDASDIEIGDILEQDENLAYVEDVDYTTGVVTIDSEQDWVTSTADVRHLKAIHCAIQWNNEFADNPAGLKMFFETNLLFKQQYQKRATVYFFSDVNPSESSIDIESAAGNGAFGDFPFGEVPFGGDSVPTPVRLGVPREHKRCNLLTVRFESQVAFSDFQLNGLSLTYNPTSTRTTRSAG